MSRLSHDEMRHGMDARPKRRPRPPGYSSWANIKSRCLNPNNERYHRYGGRGISICDRWADSFEHFLADVGPRPGPGYSIDRIDNDGDYEPGNCRWATATEQSQNRERCFLTLNGVRLPIREWAKRCGVSAPTITNRRNAGLPPELIIAPPTPHGDRNHLGFAMRPRVSK